MASLKHPRLTISGTKKFDHNIGEIFRVKWLPLSMQPVIMTPNKKSISLLRQRQRSLELPLSWIINHWGGLCPYSIFSNDLWRSISRTTIQIRKKISLNTPCCTLHKNRLYIIHKRQRFYQKLLPICRDDTFSTHLWFFPLWFILACAKSRVWVSQS